METLDSKFFEEFKALPKNAKIQVWAYLKSIKKEISAEDPKNSQADKNYISGHAGPLSVSEDFEEYLVKNDLASIIQSLPEELQTEFWQFVEKLKTKASSISPKGKTKLSGKPKTHPKFKPGFGGAKDLIILKEGWDDPMTELFEEYT